MKRVAPLFLSGALALLAAPLTPRAYGAGG